MPGLREFTCDAPGQPVHVVMEMLSDASPVTFPRIPKRDSHVFILKAGVYVCAQHHDVEELC